VLEPAAVPDSEAVIDEYGKKVNMLQSAGDILQEMTEAKPTPRNKDALVRESPAKILKQGGNVLDEAVAAPPD